MSVFVDNHWRKVTSRLAFGVAGEVAIFADEIDNGVTEDRLTVLTKYAAENLDMLVTYEPGEKLKPEVITEGTWEPFTARALSKALRDQVRRPFSLSISPEDDWVNIGIQFDHGVLRVLALERRLFSSSAYIFLFWLGGSSVILFTIAIIFMRNQIRPIRRLALAAEQLLPGRVIYYMASPWSVEPDVHAVFWADPAGRIWRRWPKKVLGVILKPIFLPPFPAGQRLAFQHVLCVSGYIQSMDFPTRGV